MEIVEKKYDAMNDSDMAKKILDVIGKHGKALGDLYDELNGSTYRTQYESILTARCTTRMVERVVEMLAAGAEPLEAVRYEMASPMFDIDSETADAAIESVVNSAKGKGIR